ncbi:MAG: thermonuclease family protein [Robiginitomaculum sp.]|nr:thermonuclease family protein [Robiginitomaculum sp.]
MKLILSIVLIVFISIPPSYSKSVPIDEQIELKSMYEVLKYERVVDGDTFIASGKRIRIWGIDAPEKGEISSMAATMYLEILLNGGELTCKLIQVDRYRRDVMNCLVAGRDIASQLVLMGMANDYSKYSGHYYQKEEDVAKNAKRGIWKDLP